VRAADTVRSESMSQRAQVAAIVFAVAFTLYGVWWWLAASSYCTGTGGCSYDDTLACKGDVFAALIFIVLNAAIYIGLQRVWSSGAVPRVTTIAITLVCAFYILGVVVFPLQFWMSEPAFLIDEIPNCYLGKAIEG
jgi:cytochrome bd-type quinol oxidase subunit 2